MASVDIRSVTKRFGSVQVLHGVDVDIDDGEFVVLVGPSGCGKSTLLRMIAGLENITSGEIRIGPRVVNNVAPKERDIAMVFQNYALYPHMTVYDNMAFSLMLAGAPKDRIQQEVNRAAGILGLGQFLGRYPRQLSGGQRQRVAMGRAIVRNPQVFLFDEPLSNLDAKLRVQMRAEIKDLHQRLKVTTVYVTHDQIEAMTMADKIVAMSDGNVEQIGSPLDLYDHPTNLFVASFIGSPAMNLLKGEISGDQFRTEGGAMLPLPKSMGSGPAVYGIRPEYIHLSPDKGIEARVHLVEPMGSETQVSVRVGETPLVCTFRERVNAKPGEAIRIMPDRALAHVFDAEKGNRISIN
ncbi:sn-glycerol-3-phosphate ABC transporter ATP-binding protein UgpC [Bradyrhizobium sp. LHD-71]|uniref:ABC transporter ATP-binding protein n=1 Tax=Bradyrhizobium sp. LHD-71 TaxID=3072141 RepID=UPI00280FEAF9|nr:sn-glycerol-3-phosphate ABC transporter ATP-binding protein UgpC [Bradyrhizobium sp. LHD-71]MDQ8732386.1 sn-glycerol-3-phosphate ABC transporter ATP-binding protein UgpC [Bradyrhizobium sp. LHD-71]